MDTFWASTLRGRARDGNLGLEARTVLGFGNGAGGGRAPSARMRQSAERVFSAHRVLSIDEYYTTKTCHVCGDVLQGVIDTHKNFLHGLPAGAHDHGLKHCARSSCSSFLDRDVNVSIAEGDGWEGGREGGGGGGDDGPTRDTAPIF